MKFFRWGRSFNDEDYSFDVWVAFGRVLFSVARDEGITNLTRYSINVEVIHTNAWSKLRA